MKFWKVTIRQQLPRKRYSLHQFVVAATDATAAESLVRDEYRASAGQYDADVEPVAPGEVIRGRASVHKVG